MIDFIVGAIIVAVVGLALAYIIRSRKNGIKCVGCPDARTCHSSGHAGDAVSVGGCDGKSCASCGGCHTSVK